MTTKRGEFNALLGDAGATAPPAVFTALLGVARERIAPEHFARLQDALRDEPRLLAA